MQPSTFREIQDQIQAFVEAREWGQFHSPKNLAAAISVEAGELLAHFRWLSEEESNDVVKHPEVRAEVDAEIADVLILTLELADRMGIDPAEAVRRKLAVNEARYPVDKSRGRNVKYNRL
ncbi:MAG: nucleotide pyrophosphohydrolase [Phycisphaerae bacterium]|jgi:NTP pyrophosphatase (non-canonical NTP hydrolase)|nr:nucleotide pyrophosphohydrolase [Phycisphaerae bacterium]